ncbi:HlyD family efflux transporter periplasmic adaptor subunit [Diplocloster hominis]|uniref:HlyD family efflux transporter periplasmic adaptor subunit n=1 Tax=Diplocloster hominis TaxID=3079010 RepID=UPI0031BA75D9
MDKEKKLTKAEKKQKLMKLLIGFFVLMLILTILSRAIDAVMLPKVDIGKKKEGNLVYKVNGEGTVRPAEAVYTEVPLGYRVNKVLPAGTKVTAGQGIIFLDTKDLEEQKEERSIELEKLQLAYEQQEYSNQPSGKVSEEEQALSNLEQAQKHYDQSLNDVDDAKNVYEANMNAKKAECDQIRENAKAALDQALPEEKEQAQKDYEAAVAQADADFKSYEEQQRQAVEAVADQRDSFKDALDQAENARELAKKNDEYSKKNEENIRKAAELGQRIRKLEIQQKEQDLAKIDELIADGGEVQAEVDGVITRMGVVPGTSTTGTEIVEIGTGAYQFVGTLSESALELVQEGDSIDVALPQQKGPVKAQIQTIQPVGASEINAAGDTAQADDDRTTFIAELPEGEYRISGKGTYSLEKMSDTEYRCLIPIEALREDQSGKYCLILEKKSTILGESDVAVRVPIVVLKSNSQYAAIEDALTADDRIITGSSKNVSEGDRVRVGS